MAALETKLRAKTTPADHPVFVAGDGRRARRLRHVAVIVGVLAILWIIGLGVGMLGFGSLPGVALVKGAREDSRPAEVPSLHVAQPDNEPQRVLSADGTSVRGRAAQSTSSRRAVGRVATKPPAAAKGASHAPATKPAAPTPTPVNPAQRTRGWARNGYSAPRGQLRKAAPPPPPTTSRGRRVGQANVTPAPPPAVPPGQVKKAAEPPPPPPPPKKG